LPYAYQPEAHYPNHDRSERLAIRRVVPFTPPLS